MARTSLELLRDLRFAIFGCAAILLFVVSTFVAMSDYARSLRQYADLRGAALRHSALESVPLVRLPSRFLFMSELGEPGCPNVLVAVPGYLDSPHADVATTDLLPRGFPLDWSFAVAYIFSLAVLVGTHDVVVRQRENGTLKVLLSYPAKRAAVLAGEYAGTLFVVVPLLLVAFLCGLIVVVVSGRINWQSSDWMRFAVFVVLSILFLSFVAACGLLISIIFRDRTTCLLVAILTWVTAAIALPAIAQTIAQVVAPAETPREHARQLEDARFRFRSSIRVSSEMLQPVVTASALSEDKKNELLRGIQVDLVRQHEAIVDEYTKHLLRIRASYLASVDHEATLSRSIALASPLYFYLELIADVAGSGPANDAAFRRAAGDFMERYTPACLVLRRELRPLAKVGGPTVQDGPYRLQGVSWVSYEGLQYDRRSLPVFGGYEVPVEGAGYTLLIGALLLLGLNAFIFFLAVNRLNRYVVI